MLEEEALERVDGLTTWHYWITFTCYFSPAPCSPPYLGSSLSHTFLSLLSQKKKKRVLIHMTPTVLSMDDVTSQKGLSGQRSLVQPPAHNMKVRSGCSSKSSSEYVRRWRPHSLPRLVPALHLSQGETFSSSSRSVRNPLPKANDSTVSLRAAWLCQEPENESFWKEKTSVCRIQKPLAFPVPRQIFSFLSSFSIILKRSCTKLLEHRVAVLKGGRIQLEIKAKQKTWTDFPLTEMLSKCCPSIHHEN